MIMTAIMVGGVFYRKFALRLGHLAEEPALYNLRPAVTRKL